MGQRDAFSTPDVQKLNKMYKCPSVGIEEARPPLNAHNNIDELIGDIDEEITTMIPSTTTGRLPVPQRPPNRPLLNILGGLISNALNQGK